MIADGEMEIFPSVSALFAASGIGLTFTVARYAMPDAFDTANLLISMWIMSPALVFHTDDGFSGSRRQQRQASGLADPGRCARDRPTFAAIFQKGMRLRRSPRRRPPVPCRYFFCSGAVCWFDLAARRFLRPCAAAPICRPWRSKRVGLLRWPRTFPRPPYA